MRVADLFAGCGGMSRGFQAAGYDVVFAADTWQRARLVYDGNFDHRSYALDLSDVIASTSAVMKADAEVVVGGPPCQEFSAAGLRMEAERADLTWSFAEIVRGCRPTWFVMENVPEAGASRAWAIARVRLGSAGYGLTEMVLDASRYGVPQLRKRRFLIGRVGEQDGFLESVLREMETSKPLSVSDYLKDEFGVEHYYRHPRHWGRRAIYSIHEPAATVRSTNRPVPPKYRSHPLDSAPIECARLLSGHQRARLQTFDLDFDFNEDLYQFELDLMVANAVPVQLARNVGEAMRLYEECREVSFAETEFRAWLRDRHNYTERSAGNVVSRLKRAHRFADSGVRHIDPKVCINAMQRHPEFVTLPSSVRSQLKRAILLHAEFSSR